MGNITPTGIAGGRYVSLCLLVGLLAIVACTPRSAAPTGGAPRAESNAVSVEDFYRGKTVTIVVGYAPGGGFDTTARVLARHMGDHLPGHPAFVVENMDGAGSLVAVNYLYNVAKPDGLSFGTFNEQQVLNQVTGIEGVQFDARKLSWIGSASGNTPLCSIRADSRYQSGRDLLRSDLPPLVVGGTAPGANTDDFPKLLNSLLGTNFKLVSGYRGSADIRLATEAGEVEGICWSLEALESGAPQWIENRFISIPIYEGGAQNTTLEARFPNAIRAEDLTTDEAVRRLIRAANAPGDIAKPFAGPPGIPPDRLQTLRDAFKETVADPAFLADAEQAKLTIVATFGEDTARIVGEILDLPPDLAARLAEIRK